MTGSPSAAIESIDYGRFAERLAAQRANQDPAKRWDLYREFQQEWGYVPTGGERWEGGDPVDADDEDLDEEFDEDELEALVPPEKIPAALPEWWKLPFNSFADSWLMYWTNPLWPPTWRPDPSGYGVAEGLDADSPLVVDPEDLRLCCFNAEYQYCNEWAYLSAEADQPDPRVLVSVADGWEVQADSLSEFFLLLAVTRLPASLGWTAHTGSAEDFDTEDFDTEDFDTMAARVRAAMPALGFHPWRELMSTKVFHGGPDVLAMVDPTGEDVQLCLYGRSREALERATAALGGEWSIAEPNPPKREDENGDGDEDGDGGK